MAYIVRDRTVSKTFWVQEKPACIFCCLEDFKRPFKTTVFVHCVNSPLEISYLQVFGCRRNILPSSLRRKTCRYPPLFPPLLRHVYISTTIRIGLIGIQKKKDNNTTHFQRRTFGFSDFLTTIVFAYRHILFLLSSWLMKRVCQLAV